jgi:hypothetical protein
VRVPVVEERESGFSIRLPDGLWFRLASTETYRRLGGRALKEMDFGYLDEAARRLVLVELTSYDRAMAAPESKQLLPEMIAKARDSLLMLQAVWRGHGEGKALALELPEACRTESRLLLCFVVKLNAVQPVSFVMSDLRGRLKSCMTVGAELLGLEVDVELLDHRKAMEKLPLEAHHED